MMKIKVIGMALLAILILMGCKETGESVEAATEEKTTLTDDDFNAKVDLVKALFKAYEDEDIEAISAMLADTLRYSPTAWNDNQWLSKDDFLAMASTTHQAVDNLKFTPGIVLPNTTAGGFFAGRNFPTQESAPTEIGLIRAYGSWSSTNSESGETNNSKWYGLFALNEDDKFALISAYFDAIDSQGDSESKE